MSVNSTTLLIRVADKAYPKYLSDLRAEHKDSIFPPVMEEEDVLALGYAVVNQVTAPPGDVVTESLPVQSSGKYYRNWEARDFNEVELKANLESARSSVLSQLDTLFLKDAAAGLRYDLNGEVFHVQIRASDKSNLIILRYMADIALAANDTTPMVFRSFENLSHSMTPAEMSVMMGAAFFSGSALYAACWALKDQAVAATQLSELPVVPATLYV